MTRKSLIDNRNTVYLFFLVFVVYALVYMTKNCYSAAMASIVNAGIMTKSQTGLISAAFYLIYAPFQILGGIAADRYSPSNLILIGVLGAGIANLLIYYFAESYIAMTIIWSLNAIVQFGVWPSIFKIVTTQLAPEYRVSCMFYISLSSTVGLLISYLCAMLIEDWKKNFLVSAITLFITALVFFFCYRKIEKAMIEDEPPTKIRTDVTLGERQSILRLLFKSGVPFMLVVNVIYNMLNLGVKSLTPTMLMESYEAISPSLANGLNIILVLAAPIGLFLARLRFFRKFSPITVVGGFLCICLPLLFLITLIGRIPSFFIMTALALLMVSLGAGSIFFSYISLSFVKYGKNGTLSGLFNSMASLGIVLANYVFAKLADVFGWGFTTKGWLILTAFSLLLCLVTLPIWKRFVKTELS